MSNHNPLHCLTELGYKMMQKEQSLKLGNRINHHTKPLLSKSKFKLGLECANKLFFALDKNYVSAKKNDPFLESLAEGGFQVEEYARQHFPQGVFIQSRYFQYSEAHNQTMHLLSTNENIVLFEAGFIHEGLFVRSDIIVKQGNHIQLIEVKAKSYDINNDKKTIITSTGQLRAEWKPYLFDLAFQKHVIQSCLPDMQISSYLMLADKNKIATKDGLNQNYRISKSAEVNRYVQVLDSTPIEWDQSIMILLNQTDTVREILNDEIPYRENQNFSQSLTELKRVFDSKQYPAAPLKQSACRNCEFRKKDITDPGLSGMAKCFAHHRQINEKELHQPNLLDVWNLRNSKLFDQGKFGLAGITEEMLDIEDHENEFSTTRRQWIQISSTQSKEVEHHLFEEPLIDAMKEWKYPLHFIDFETSRSALPFYAGRRPYEQIAFQFSHHIMDEKGTVAHHQQALIADGRFPNFEFIRRLKASLSNDRGTVFTYSHHENTVINEIKVQLEKSNEEDAPELIAFIDDLGQNRLVDLHKVVKKYFYHPYMGGSISIKAVLPAILLSSPYLQNKYSQEIGKIGVTSLNFPKDHVWISQNNLNPYKALQSVFDNISEEIMNEQFQKVAHIQDGGAAMMAYGLLMYCDIPHEARQSLENALLRYCELDTLAMVMLYEHLRELTNE